MTASFALLISLLAHGAGAPGDTAAAESRRTPPVLPTAIADSATATPAGPAPGATATAAPSAGPVAAPLLTREGTPRGVSTDGDTGVRRRPRAVEYSDWYARRLTLHRWASFTMLPLFATQYAAGDQLMRHGSAAPAWARQSHGALAGGVAGLFGLNTATGLWNLWDARHDPSGRALRIAHSLLMLAGDAGFTATGLLAESAQNDGSRRALHRQVALGSMAVATLGYAIMLPPFRRD